MAAGHFDAADLRGTARARLLWAYGLGDVGTGMGAALIGFYLLRFYVAAGLPPWLAGLAYGVGRLWDAINDPVVGWLSDKTARHPWGPRVPWIVWSALPLGAAMAAMWWLPPWSDTALRAGFFVAISVIANSLYTCVNLPYTALAAELSSDERLRTRLNTARFSGSILATITAALLAGLLVQNLGDPRTYMPVGLVSGLIIAVTALLCGWGLLPLARRCRRPESRPGTTRRLLQRVGRNSRFLMVLGLYLLLWCALQLMQAVSLFFLPVVLQLPEGLSKLNPAAVFAQLPGRPVAVDQRGLPRWQGPGPAVSAPSADGPGHGGQGQRPRPPGPAARNPALMDDPATDRENPLQPAGRCGVLPTTPGPGTPQPAWSWTGPAD